MVEFMQQGATMTPEVYCKTRIKLRETIQDKWRGMHVTAWMLCVNIAVCVVIYMLRLCSYLHVICVAVAPQDTFPYSIDCIAGLSVCGGYDPMG
jgi:hypothetical protein